MYQTVLMADSPSADEVSTTEGCSITITGRGLAGASAALSALQTAAFKGLASAQVLLPVSCGCGSASAGLPGMLKSWAAETGAAVATEQQPEAGSKAVLQFTTGARDSSQTAFTEQESR
jgi:hypothetical protein